jgi:transcriptional regulator with XRE-family HTH domain
MKKPHEMQTLRQARKARLLTIRGLAESAGVSPYTVHQVERGVRPPRFATIRRLSEALGVEPATVAEFHEVMHGKVNER